MREYCRKCKNYEPEDLSAGQLDGCTAEEIYDADGEIIEAKNEEIIKHMDNGGKSCPYYDEIEGR